MGNNNGLPERLSPEDESRFPNLSTVGYRVKSHPDTTYNCVAYAAGDKTRKWDSAEMPVPGYYWPAGASRGDGVESLRSAFEAIGYEVCVGGDREDGFEKVALYVDNEGYWTHAAHQDGRGQWSSKLGDMEDIIHRTPDCFGGAYGNVVYFMRRTLLRSGIEGQEEADQFRNTSKN